MDYTPASQLRSSSADKKKADFKATVIRTNGMEADVTLEGSTTNLTNNMAAIMEAVKQEQILLSDSDAFSNDTLRIEISGPDQPHLTLVNLPGIFEAATTAQLAEQAQTVNNIVASYMNNAQSIILAGISAADEFQLQQVTKFAHEIDPTGERTLGRFILLVPVPVSY